VGDRSHRNRGTVCRAAFFAIQVDAQTPQAVDSAAFQGETSLLAGPRHQALRTVWLSDVHLGSRECRVNLLLDFLRHTRCDVLYLVGDIVDLENLRKSFYWPVSHTEVLRLLLKKSQEGTRIVYVPGNHDHDLHALAGARFGNVEIASHAIHTTRQGRRLLVTHGDPTTRTRSSPASGLAGF
jgi:predicted phosphodiesterase